MWVSEVVCAEFHHPLSNLQTQILDKKLDLVRSAEDLESINGILYGVAEMTGFHYWCTTLYELDADDTVRLGGLVRVFLDKCFWWRVVNLKLDTIFSHVEKECWHRLFILVGASDRFELRYSVLWYHQLQLHRCWVRLMEQMYPCWVPALS